MLVQNLEISDPLALQQAFSQIITGDIIPTSGNGCPCSVGYRFLSPVLSLIWGTYSHLSGAWHTLGGTYISISIDETPFYFKGKKIGLLENPLEVTLTYNHQEIDFSFTHPYRSLVLYVDTAFLQRTYESLLQKSFQQEKNHNLINFRDQKRKDALVRKLLPLSYKATENNLNPLAALETSEEIVEELVQGLEFDESNIFDRTTCQSLAVKAHEFLLSKPHERVTLSQVTSELKAPLRSIQKGFQEIYGLSPMEYHQRYRLFQLRRHLLRYGREKIADTGKLFGFHHPGRLSKIYKDAFGVLPSQDNGEVTTARTIQKLGITSLPSF